MKTRVKTAAVSIAVVALLGGGVIGAVARSGASSGSSGLQTSSAQPTVSAAVAKDLTFLREEERLARDLYAALGDYYDGARPFSMITHSEQRHFEMVGALLSRYGIKDPSAGRVAGSYADPVLQTLYDRLFAQGKGSLVEANQAGVVVEERDIADLRRAINSAGQAEIKTVLGRLLAASQQHLRAFSGDLSGLNGTRRVRSCSPVR